MIKRFISSRSGALTESVARLTLPEKIILALIVLGIAGLVTMQVHAYDIFWQLQSGKYMVQNLTWIYTDIFSLAADAPRWEHCWLHDVIFYGVWLLGGYSAISLFKGVLLTATFLVIVAVARLRGSSLWSILFLSVPAFLYTNSGWLERPQLWSFLCCALFLLIFERNRQREFAGTPWLLFLVAVCWANLHAGAVLAIPLLGAWLIGSVIDRKWLKHPFATEGLRGRQIWMSVVLVLAGLSLTPYGPQLLAVLFTAPTLGEASGEITQIFNYDWQPMTFRDGPYFYYALVFIPLVWVVGWKKISFYDLFLFGGLALMGVTLKRHVPFFLLAFAALLPSYLDTAVRRWLPEPGARIKLLMTTLLIAGAFGWIFVFARPIYAAYGFFNPGLATERFPVSATEFVKEQRLPRNLFNSYPWGGYLMWRLYPDYLVFFDARQDSPEMFAEGYNIEGGHRSWQQLLHKYDVNTLVLSPLDNMGKFFGLTRQIKKAENWLLVYADDHSLVLTRKGSMPPSWETEHTLPKSRIDDAIFGQATAVVKKYPAAYEAYWQMASVLLARNEHQQAFLMLDEYFKYAPVAERRADAIKYHNLLFPLYGHLRKE